MNWDGVATNWRQAAPSIYLIRVGGLQLGWLSEVRLGAVTGRAGLAVWTLALVLFASVARATPIVLVDHRAAGFVGQTQFGPLDQPVLIENYAQFKATFGASTAGLADPYLAPSVEAFFANVGAQLYVVRVASADDASLIGVDGGVPGASTGLQALRDVPEVAFVAIPGATSHDVQAAMIEHCESMGGRIAVLDPVSTTDISAVTAQRAALSTVNGFGTLYFPWVQAAPADGSLPPSGFVAGLLARTTPQAAQTGSLFTASGVSLTLNSTQLSQLNLQGIDTIRLLSGQGVVVWGVRTLASNTEWQYLSVRRRGSIIQGSIEAGTAWCRDVANDALLWTQLRADMGAFMQTLFVNGWFQGASPSQAYFVKCDETTMTAEDISEGRTVMLVGFAPITPGEFLLLHIVQQRENTAAVGPSAGTLRLSPPHPNPVRGRALIVFELPDAAAVTLTIHDIGGRAVRTLAGGETMAAGRYEQAWDGRDDAGGAAPTGIYLLRLHAGTQTVTRRMARVR